MGGLLTDPVRPLAPLTDVALGHQLARTLLAVVNGLEVPANVATPRKCRAWINAITLGFHVVVIYKTARRPIGVLVSPGSEQIARIGLRLWW
jgi:hypothetical protein